MFAVLAEAAVERGEGEIRGEEEAKERKGGTRRVELVCEVPSTRF